MQYTMCLIWKNRRCIIGELVTFSVILDSSIRDTIIPFFFSSGFVLRTEVISPFFTLHTCFDSSNLGEAQRVCHSQVPVQRYTAKEGDADVDISVEDEAKQFAALLTMDPVIMLQEVVDPQRESGDVEEVSYRQVDQVNAELIALAYLEGGMWWGEGDNREERLWEERRGEGGRMGDGLKEKMDGDRDLHLQR